MSAFLGPIHYWLYNKIQIQQQLVEDMIGLGKQHNLNLQKELDEQFGVSETRALEEVIDQTNIHAWLQKCVSQVENKLAYSVTKLLEKDPTLFDELQLIFQNKGQTVSITEHTDNAAVVFKAISDSLLDGMPCDHANSIVEESEEQVIWRRNNCVHKQYWKALNGNIEHYYQLIDSFMNGFLQGTSMEFIKIDEETYQIRRK
jgi:hypothetical protein